MAKAKKSALDSLGQYQHDKQQRLNNPPVGLVTPTTDMDGESKTYQYDPHLDPQLIWSGKAEHTSFEVPTVSLHVHERIDPKAIIKRPRKAEARYKPPFSSFLARPAHENGGGVLQASSWLVNRLIAGDSLQVMNSLLEKEGMAGP
jgi:adenine-specific DNA-methyltransferase